MKVRVEAYRIVDRNQGTYTQAVLRDGARVAVELNGPDADVRRIVDLGLRPVITSNGSEVWVSWLGKLATGYDEPGGFREVFSDVAVTVFAGNEPVFTSDKIEASCAEPEVE